MNNNIRLEVFKLYKTYNELPKTINITFDNKIYNISKEKFIKKHEDFRKTYYNTNKTKHPDWFTKEEHAEFKKKD